MVKKENKRKLFPSSVNKTAAATAISKKDFPPIRRTLSVDSIAPTISSLFKRKRNHSPNNDKEPSPSEDVDVTKEPILKDSEPAHKRRKVKTLEEEEFEKREKEYDEMLPPEYRKFRPKGYKFNLPPKDRPIRIYADGVFDLFHIGHMKQLEQAKKAFENVELICGIPSDVETHARKGLTVLTDEQRCETLRHCKWVDDVIPNAPWCVNSDFLKKHNIDYAAHDDLPYAADDTDDIYKEIKEKGMFLATQRTEGISTSDIITKIIRDYDKYLMRNFARGATRKELNVSWFKKNELDIKKQLNDFRSYWMKNKENLNNVSRDLYFEVREYMRGKKFDVSQYLENSNSASSNTSNNNSDSEDNGSVKLMNSPLSEFAAKYIGNANKELNLAKKTIIANVRDFFTGDDDDNDSDDFNGDGDDDEIKPIKINSPNKSVDTPPRKPKNNSSFTTPTKPVRKTSSTTPKASKIASTSEAS